MPIVDREKERQIVERALDRGWSEDKIRQAVLTFRAQQTGSMGVRQEEPKTVGAVQEIKKGAVGIGEDIKERGKSISETVQETWRQEITPMEMSLRVVGDVAGGIGDIIGGGVATGVTAIAPESAEELVKGKVNNILSTQAGQAALNAVSQGLDKYNEWKGENPRAAKSIEAVLNIAALFPIERAAGVAVKGTAKAAVSGSRVASKVGKVASEAAETAIKQADDVFVGLKQAIRDVVPTNQQVVSQQITNALSLTKGDTANLLNSTGNELGEFLIRNNLIGNNKDETVTLLGDFFGENYKTVRDAIGQVDRRYVASEVPKLADALNSVKKEIGDVVGLEADNKIIDDLLGKETLELTDIQKAKEMLDEHFNLYKVTGDPAAGARKEGLRNVRRELKEFIEKEVRENAGMDIASLNNNVMTARSITDAIRKRSTTGLTKGNISLSDLGTFGGITFFGGPVFGVAAIVIKKIIESPSFRLRFSKWLNGLSEAKKLSVRDALKKGELPEDMPASLLDELKTDEVA